MGSKSVENKTPHTFKVTTTTIGYVCEISVEDMLRVGERDDKERGKGETLYGRLDAAEAHGIEYDPHFGPRIYFSLEACQTAEEDLREVTKIVEVIKSYVL